MKAEEKAADGDGDDGSISSRNREH